MDNLIGKTIANRYRTDSLLGQGGMGNVYKVWDSQRRVFLAMKTLHPDLAEDKVFLRRFAREAETLAALQHPNIVRFYGLGQDGRLTFILMDYIEGTTLRGIIFDSQKPLSVNQVLQIIKPVCSALHYAHQNGRIHCDIKPANIMVKPNGEVLLADFGISRMIETHTTMTLAGAGTPPYMAPEQILVKKPVPQTDIYALGVILYEMLTGGERPFTGELARIDGGSSEKVMWEHVHLLPPSPRKYNPSISRQLELVVLKCLEKEVTNRYIDVVSLLNTLSADTKGNLHQTLAAKEQKPIARQKKANILSDSIAQPNNEIVYDLWYKRMLLGVILGFLAGTLIRLLIDFHTDPTVSLILAGSSGLAALILYPHKLSLGLIALGFFIFGGIFAVTYVPPPYTFFVVFSSFGVLFGIPIGALISRILYWLKIIK